MGGTIKNSPGVGHKKMRILGSYALVYLLEGSGRYCDTKGRDFSVCRGDLLLIFPEIAHRYGPEPGTRWSEIYLVFTGSVFDLWREANLLFEQHPLVHLDPVPFWQTQIAEAIPQNTDTPDRLAAVCRLQTLLVNLHRAARQQNVAISQWFQTAKKELSKELQQPIDLPQLARRLGLSYESFRKKFTLLAGMPPARFRLVQRIRAASTLLYEQQLTNSQIAERLGFTDEFHFAKTFKKITGQTPRTFRLRLPQ